MLRPLREGELLWDGAGPDDLLLRPEVTAGGAALTPALTEAAWHDLHERLRGFVSRRVTVKADAEDIVQQVFLRLHRSLASLRRSDRTSAWLHQAARNAIADHYRTPARRREVLFGDARDMEGVAGSQVAESDADPSPAVQAAPCLRPMIARLSENDRRALDLVELQGMTQVAAAAGEGLSLSGMKARVQRARRRLLAALRECCFPARGTPSGLMACGARDRDGSAC